MSYFVETQSWTCCDVEIWPVLSTYEGKFEFKQDFERAWTALEFSSPREALTKVREMFPNVSFYLNEDHSRIMSIYGDEVVEHFRITKGQE